MDRKWKTELRLTYRKFGRQMEDSELAFEQVRTHVSKLEPVRTTYGEVTDDFWPLRPESQEATEARGIFVTETLKGLSVVIREMPITILCDDYADADARLNNLLDNCPCKFAVVEIVRNYLTEHVAD